MPAGHSCPPQPFFRSSFNNNGSLSRPSNVVVVVPAALMSRGGANEALTLKGASGSDSGLGDLSMGSFDRGTKEWANWLHDLRHRIRCKQAESRK